MPAEKRTPNPTEAESLLSGSRRDATAAHSLYNKLKLGDNNNQYKADLCLTLAGAYLSAGLDYKPFLAEADTAITSISPEQAAHRTEPMLRKAFLLHRAGETSEAFKTLEDLGSYSLSRAELGYLKIAETVDDPSTVKRATDGILRIADTEVHDAHKTARLYQHVAKVQHMKGEDALPLLKRAHAIIKEKYEDTKSFHLYLYYKPLAESYAQCGYFEQAYSLIRDVSNRFPKESQQEAIRNIARSKIEAGQISEARVMARDTADPYTIADMECFALYTQAKRKKPIDPEAAVVAVKLYELQGGSLLADLHTILAETNFVLGEDPQPLFQYAEGHLNKASMSDREKKDAIDDLVIIAQSQARCNIDPKNTLTKAFGVASSIKPKDVYDGVDLLISVEDIGNTATDTGCNEVSNKVLSWYKENLSGGVPDIEDMINLLARRAEAQAKKAKALQAG